MNLLLRNCSNCLVDRKSHEWELQIRKGVKVKSPVICNYRFSVKEPVKPSKFT